MATLSSKLVVSLVDRLSGPAGRAVRSIQAMKAAGAGVSGVTTALDRNSRRFARSVRRLNSGGAGMAGLGATAGSVAFIANEVEVQNAMNRTRAILNITNKEAFKPHSDLVVELAKKYPTTSAEIAKGASELAMAGMSMKEVNEVLEATVQGSMASGESIKTVGMGVTDVVMGLGRKLTKENFLDVNNTLAAAATSYAQDYTQFLAGLAKTAPIARMVGLPLDKLSGVLGILADAGFKAEKGGTALRTSMINMAAPTNKAQAWLKQYGVDLTQFQKVVDTFQLRGSEGAGALSGYITDALNIDAEGLDLSKVLTPLLSDETLLGDIPALKRKLGQTIASTIGVDDPENTQKIGEAVEQFVQAGFKQVDVMALMRKLGKVGFDDNTEAMKELFGKRFTAQMGAVINSLRNGTFDFKFDELFSPRIAGAVERFAEILMSGLPGALKRLGGAFDGLLRAMANSGAIDTVAQAMESLRDIINRMSETSPGTLKAITLALLGLGALAPIGFIVSGIGAGLGAIAAVAGVAASGMHLVGAALLVLGRAATFGAVATTVSGIAAGFGSIAAVGAKAAATMRAFALAAALVGGGGAAKIALSGLGAAAMAMLNPMRLLAPVIRAVGVALRFAFVASGVGAVITAIAAGGLLIYNNWSGIAEFFSGVGEGIMSGLGPARPLVEGIATAIGDVWNWLAALTGPLDASKEQWREWGRSVGEFIAAPIRLLGEAYDLLTNNALTRALGLSGSESADAPAAAKKASGAGLAPTQSGPPMASVAATSAPAAKPTASAPSTASNVSQVDAAQLQAALDRLSASAAAIPGAVQQAVSQARSIASGVDLTSSGVKIMQSLANGMRSAIPQVAAAMQTAAAEIKAHVPQSPAKKGPLRGLHGRGIITEIAKSMNPAPMVNAMNSAAAQTRAAAMGGPSVPSVRGGSAAGAAGGGEAAGLSSSGDVFVTVNIPTGVTDPQRIGDEVGRSVRNAVRETYSDGGI